MIIDRIEVSETTKDRNSIAIGASLVLDAFDESRIRDNVVSNLVLIYISMLFKKHEFDVDLSIIKHELIHHYHAKRYGVIVRFRHMQDRAQFTISGIKDDIYDGPTMERWLNEKIYDTND